MRVPLLAALLLACSGCGIIAHPSGLIAKWTDQWKEVATPNDSARLAGWRSSLVDAVQAASKAHAAEITAQGPLLQPDSALGPPGLTAGDYRCRVIKLGAKAQGNLDYAVTPPSLCQVRDERGLLRLSKVSGSQRYVGLVFPGDGVRQVFLGTLVLGDQTRALQYGQDELRDVAGYVERIGPNRWRLLMPRPHFESRLDVMELVPVTG